MIDGAEEYPVEPGSRRDAGNQTKLLTMDSRCRWLSIGFAGIRQLMPEHLHTYELSTLVGVSEIKSKSWRVHAKDRLQVAICEPVEVDGATATSSEDSGPKERIPSSWDNIASTAIPTSLASFARLELNLWTEY